MAAIKTEKLTKKYKDVTAVDNLDLTVGQQYCYFSVDCDAVQKGK